MEHSVLIEGGLVVTPGGARELDVLVVGEHIVAVAVSGAIDGSGEVVDARGMVVLPGAVDGHTHLMQHDPDVLAAIPDEYEGFEAGGRGAAAGGVTTVVEMPQASPLTTDGHTFRRKRELAGTHAIVDYALWGGVTAGQDPAAIRQQLDEGAVGLKAFMCDSDPDFPPVDTAELASALEVLAPTGVMMGLHAESNELLQAGLVAMQRAGRVDPLAHAESRPPIVEAEAVSRAIFLAERHGAWVHIVHMSTGDAADLVAAARARGVRVTCETCPQYLALDEDDLARLGPFARCAPPIRPRSDVERLWEHISRGTIDAITTDHCAFTYDTRLRGRDNIFETPNGLTGIETLVPVVVTEGRRRGLSWETLARLLATGPSNIWGLAPRKGRLEPGADADIVLLDPAREWTITGAQLHHTHKWTPFEGFRAVGKVVRTMVRGTTVFTEAEDVVGEPGFGTFVPRGRQVGRLEPVPAVG